MKKLFILLFVATVGLIASVGCEGKKCCKDCHCDCGCADCCSKDCCNGHPCCDDCCCCH